MKLFHGIIVLATRLSVKDTVLLPVSILADTNAQAVGNASQLALSQHKEGKYYVKLAKMFEVDPSLVCKAALSIGMLIPPIPEAAPSEPILTPDQLPTPELCNDLV